MTAEQGADEDPVGIPADAPVVGDEPRLEVTRIGDGRRVLHVGPRGGPNLCTEVDLVFGDSMGEAPPMAELPAAAGCLQGAIPPSLRRGQ